MDQTAETLGLYLSVPFCRAKCTFCNFASGVASGAAVEGYIARLVEEIRDARRSALAMGAELPGVVNTVYLGGGTPSLLEPAQLSAVFAALRSDFQMTRDVEITLEAAPGQIGAPLLEAALACGVNRVSLGVQSFVDREAHAVGRSHTEASCRAEFARLRGAGVVNLGADLIAGLPYQTEASWQTSLDVAGESGLAHLSVYMLEVDDESRLGREVLGGGARLHAPAVPDEERVTAMYERACSWLPGAGFGQYEISNFAGPGRQSLHNLKYWKRQPYLGFGLDAHSMLRTSEGRAVRWANADELEGYQGRQSARQAEWVNERGAFEETVFLGLRLVEGLERAALAPFRSEWISEFTQSAAMLVREELMESDASRWWFTGRGRMVSGEVFGELLAGLPA